MTKSTERLKKGHRDFAALVNRKVGARLAEQRALAGLFQADLGIPMGVTMQQVQRYEAGESGLDAATLVSLSRTLGCSVADLLKDFDAGVKTPLALTPEAVAIAKGVDGIKSGGLRGIVKLLVEKLRAHERAAEKDET